jgi:hypothetical protein
MPTAKECRYNAEICLRLAQETSETSGEKYSELLSETLSRLNC